MQTVRRLMSLNIFIKDANTGTISQAFGWFQCFELHLSFHEPNGVKIARQKKKKHMGLFHLVSSQIRFQHAVRLPCDFQIESLNRLTGSESSANRIISL